MAITMHYFTSYSAALWTKKAPCARLFRGHNLRHRVVQFHPFLVRDLSRPSVTVTFLVDINRFFWKNNFVNS